MKASEILGRKKLDELLAQGKSKDEIVALAKEELKPIKEAIGNDIYAAFRRKGVPLKEIKDYADYKKSVRQIGTDLNKKLNEGEQYQKEVNAAKQAFKKLDGVSVLPGGKRVDTGKESTQFENAVTTNLARLNLVAHKLNPFAKGKPDPVDVGIVQASQELGDEYKKHHLDKKAFAEHMQDQQDIAKSDGVLDTVGAYGKSIYHTLKHPSGIDVAGAFGDLMTPENFVAGPAGKLAGKIGGKMLSATAGAGADAVANYGYEYAVQKGMGASDEDAKKAAAVNAVASVAPGVVLGAVGHSGKGIVNKVKSEWGDGEKVHNVDKTLKFDGVDKSTSTESIKEPTPDNLESVDKNAPNLASLKNNLLMVMEKADKHSSDRTAKIEEISKTISDPLEKAKAIAQDAPASPQEHYVSAILNDGQPISDRLAGFGNVEALQKSIEAGAKSPEEIHAILHAEGFSGENLDKMLESYIKKDATIYEDWAANKIKSHVGDLENARLHTADRRTNATEPKSTDSIYDSGTGETRGQNEQPQSVPELKKRGEQAERDLGQIVGKLESKDGVLQEFKNVDGHATTRADEAVVSGARENAVVPPKDGVRADKVETPTETYLKLKDEPHISPEVKAHLKALSDKYETKISASKSVEPSGVENETTKIKSTPENIATDVKKFGDLTGHRYYDDLVESIKSEMVNKEPRISAKELKAKLEKDGTWRNEDAYKAEFAKMFKKQGGDSGVAFNKYSKKELANIEARNIDTPLAKKLKEDLQEYAANPIFAENRKLIDEGLHAFADEVELLKQLKADEALHLVESDSFKDGFDKPIAVSDAVAEFDGVLKKLESEDSESLKLEADKDALFSSDREVPLDRVDKFNLDAIKDPLERGNERKKLEYKKLTEDIAKARELGDKKAIKKALEDFESWSKGNIEDGKIKKIGDC